MCGFSPEEAITIEKVRQVTHPDDLPRTWALAQQALDPEVRARDPYEYRIRRADTREVRWVLAHGEAIFAVVDGRKAAVRYVGTLSDITDRKRAEERQHLLLRELNHRVKNSLAVIQSIAARRFAKGRADVRALSDFTERIVALGKANDILLSNEREAFSATTLIEKLTQPYGPRSERISIRGTDIELPPRFNVPLALIIHELATNAAKYGSLSAANGAVVINVTAAPEKFEITWCEKGGPVVSVVQPQGFGTKLITRVLGAEIGNVDLQFAPSGVFCRITGLL
jgi:PAS domain S-box-containing protein